MKLIYPIVSKNNSILRIPDLKLEINKEHYALHIQRLGINQFLKIFIEDHLEKIEEDDNEDAHFPSPTPIEMHQGPHYEVYWTKKLNQVKPKKISGSALVVDVEIDEKELNFALVKNVYLVENKQFLLQRNGSPFVIAVTVSEEENKIMLDEVKKYNSPVLVKQNMKNALLLEKFICHFTQSVGKLKPWDDAHNLWFTIEVEHSHKIKICRTCSSNILPKIFYTTLLTEAVLNALMLINTVQASDAGLIPMSKEVSKYVLLFQGILFGAIMVTVVFYKPGFNYLEMFTEQLQNVFYLIYKKYKQCFKKNGAQEVDAKKEAINEKPLSCDKYMFYRGIAKTGLALMISNLIYSDICNDYAQFKSMRLVLDAADESATLFPRKLNIILQWITFLLNQLNDPMLFFSLWTGGHHYINTKIQPKAKMQVPENESIPEIEEKKDSINRSLGYNATFNGDYFEDEEEQESSRCGCLSKLSFLAPKKYTKQIQEVPPDERFNQTRNKCILL